MRWPPSVAGAVIEARRRRRWRSHSDPTVATDLLDHSLGASPDRSRRYSEFSTLAPAALRISAVIPQYARILLPPEARSAERLDRRRAPQASPLLDYAKQLRPGRPAKASPPGYGPGIPREDAVSALAIAVPMGPTPSSHRSAAAVATACAARADRITVLKEVPRRSECVTVPETHLPLHGAARLSVTS